MPVVAFILDPKKPGFPDPRKLEPEEWNPWCVCVCRELGYERFLNAYSRGFFPMPYYKRIDWKQPHLYNHRELIADSEKVNFNDQFQWYCPVERFVIFPDEVHISHSMRTLINSGRYRTTYDQAFDLVVEECAGGGREKDENQWLGQRLVTAYKRIHRQGLAHSVETWEGDELVGGLFGVEINGSFMGDSMFSRRPNASKMALIALADIVKSNGGKLIDCQFHTPHLESMGGRHIPYATYIKLLHGDEF